MLLYAAYCFCRHNFRVKKFPKYSQFVKYKKLFKRNHSNQNNDFFWFDRCIINLKKEVDYKEQKFKIMV